MKFKARNAEGIPNPEDREDHYHALDHEIGWYIHHRVFVRLHNKFGRNNSNDQFKDFHDYTFYGVTPIVSWHMTKKWLLVGGYHYQLNHYDDRAVHGSRQTEHLNSFFGGLYYHINPHMTWSADAIYTQADSNIPELEYKDPIYYTGVRLHF